MNKVSESHEDGDSISNDEENHKDDQCMDQVYDKDHHMNQQDLLGHQNQNQEQDQHDDFDRGF